MTLTVKDIDDAVTNLRTLAGFLSKHATELASPSEALAVRRYSQDTAIGAKKAGETIRCVTCDGKGYVVARNAFDRRPYECRSCSGSGTQTVRKPAW